ncbi:MAG: Gldg family protein [Planctomycetota bacterium]
MALTPASANPGHQQAQRRAKYGVNVAFALGAVIALALLMNWFAVWAFARLPDSARPWLRYDLTATRAYSLSDQTRQVLASAVFGDEPLELIGVYEGGTPQARAVDELLEEYAAVSAAVAVRRFEPESDAAALRHFHAELAQTLGQAGGNRPVEEAIAASRSELDRLNGRLDAVLSILNEATVALARGGAAEQRIGESLDQVAGGVVQMIDANEQAGTQVDATIDQPLPNLTQAQAALAQRLSVVAGSVGELSRWLQGNARNRRQAAAVRDAAIRAARQLEGVRASLDSARARLASVGVDPVYRRLRDAASRRAVVLVRRAGRLRAVNLDDMFVADERALDAMDPEDLTAAQTLPVRFLGEERLTGAIVSVSSDRPPLLVFVSLDGRPALGRGGTHNVVAERVRSAGFEVASYPVVSDAAATALNPAPVLEEGRRVVWFVPAAEASLPTDAAARAHLATILAERLRSGDGVLMTPGLRVGASVTAEDPLLALSENLGIGVDPGAVVLAPGVDEAGGPAAVNTFRVQTFAEHPVTKPLDGRSVWLDLAHPLDAGSANPLIALRADGMWIESDPPTDRPLSTATAEPYELTEEPIVVAAAKAQGSKWRGRFVVVADSLWSTDTVILNRQAGGNVELFTNLTYWLAGLDEAIAVTPRSQGVRRIGPMSDGGRRVAAWLAVAGWPVLALVAGTAVWAVRRRG